MRASEKEIFSTITNGIRKNSSSHRNGTDVTIARPVKPRRRRRRPTGERPNEAIASPSALLILWPSGR